jgi:hypothetical protein
MYRLVNISDDITVIQGRRRRDERREVSFFTVIQYIFIHCSLRR